MDHNLLKAAKANLEQSLKKEAFNPMTPEAQAAAAQQGAAPPPAGAPPMDPSMMDPSMMGGAPPMDPSMMGGAPPMDPATGMPLDPSMMGGAPPIDPMAMGMDPAAMGGDPMAAGTPVTLNLEDLKSVISELQGEGGGEGGEKPKRATNAQIMEQLTNVQSQLDALASALGVQLPAASVGSEASTAMPGTESNPEDIAAIAESMSGGAPAEDPMSQALAMGLPPGEMPPEAMPKMAASKFIHTRLGRR